MGSKANGWLGTEGCFSAKCTCRDFQSAGSRGTLCKHGIAVLMTMKQNMQLENDGGAVKCGTSSSSVSTCRGGSASGQESGFVASKRRRLGEDPLDPVTPLPPTMKV